MHTRATSNAKRIRLACVLQTTFRCKVNHPASATKPARWIRIHFDPALMRPAGAIGSVLPSDQVSFMTTGTRASRNGLPRWTTTRSSQPGRRSWKRPIHFDQISVMHACRGPIQLQPRRQGHCDGYPRLGERPVRDYRSRPPVRQPLHAAVDSNLDRLSAGRSLGGGFVQSLVSDKIEIQRSPMTRCLIPLVLALSVGCGESPKPTGAPVAATDHTSTDAQLLRRYTTWRGNHTVCSGR